MMKGFQEKEKKTDKPMVIELEPYLDPNSMAMELEPWSEPELHGKGSRIHGYGFGLQGHGSQIHGKTQMILFFFS